MTTPRDPADELLPLRVVATDHTGVARSVDTVAVDGAHTVPDHRPARNHNVAIRTKENHG